MKLILATKFVNIPEGGTFLPQHMGGGGQVVWVEVRAGQTQGHQEGDSLLAGSPTNAVKKLTSPTQTPTQPTPTVTLNIKSRHVTVKGPRGELSRAFKHLNIAFELIGGNQDKKTNPKKLKVDLWFGNRKQLATIRTVCSHIENLITGVTKGFLYKMRFVYAHFPINVSMTDRVVEVRNFLGEKRVRRVELLPGVEYVRTSDVKDQIELKGNDLTAVSLTAARIQQCTTVKRKGTCPCVGCVVLGGWVGGWMGG